MDSHDLRSNVIRIDRKRKSYDTSDSAPSAAHSMNTYRIALPVGAAADLVALAYPDFGLFIWRGTRLYLALRCGPVGQEGNGGHAHNDQLAMELQVDGRDWIADSGTYLYTPAPRLRNSYRSVSAHFTPQVEPAREPADLEISTFQLPDATRSRCLRFDRSFFHGIHHGYGGRVERQVEIQESVIFIRDIAQFPLKLCSTAIDGCWKSFNGVRNSTGYGIVRAA